MRKCIHTHTHTHCRPPSPVYFSFSLFLVWVILHLTSVLLFFLFFHFVCVFLNWSYKTLRKNTDAFLLTEILIFFIVIRSCTVLWFYFIPGCLNLAAVALRYLKAWGQKHEKLHMLCEVTDETNCEYIWSGSMNDFLMWTLGSHSWEHS